MDEAELDEIERRAAVAGPGEGLRAQLDPADAGYATATFVTHARKDVLRLVAAIRRSEPLPDAELTVIAERAQAAGPRPWDVFLESAGGLGGCNLIWVGGAADGLPDLYLWRGDVLAPDEDWTFIGSAREDIPRLVEAARGVDRKSTAATGSAAASEVSWIGVVRRPQNRTLRRRRAR